MGWALCAEDFSPGAAVPKRMTGPDQRLGAKKCRDHWQRERDQHRWFNLFKMNLLRLGRGP